jgi:DNA-binding MarR family transcriptional regulator
MAADAAARSSLVGMTASAASNPPSGQGATLRRDVVLSVDAIRRLLRALRLAAGETLTTSGLSAAQLFVLGALDDGCDASLSELAERTMTDRSSVTAVVDRLLDAGLVTRRVSDEDRRRAAVCITPKGRTALRGAPRPPTALLVDALQHMDRPHARSLARGLVALTREMSIDLVPAGMLFDDGAEPASADSDRSTSRRRRARSAASERRPAPVRRSSTRKAR